MAKTKAARMAKKRGRPRKEGAREPSGKLSRSGIDHEAVDKLALEVRAWKLRITPEQARDQKAGSFIGYLNLLGRKDGLSHDQYEGAQSYLRLRAAYMRAIGSPDAIYDSEALPGVSDDPNAYADWCDRTKAQYEAVRRDIQEAQNYSRENLWAALQLVVIEDRPLYAMVGTTRLLCNVLHHHFSQPQKKRERHAISLVA